LNTKNFTSFLWEVDTSVRNEKGPETIGKEKMIVSRKSTFSFEKQDAAFLETEDPVSPDLKNHFIGLPSRTVRGLRKRIILYLSPPFSASIQRAQ
jgi:hypothetical protein